MSNQIIDSIVSCVTKTQKNLIHIKDVSNKFIIFDEPNMKKSYFIENVKSSLIEIKSKVKHVFIRCCEDISVICSGNLIAGIDVLFSDRILVKSLYHPFINLEHVSHSDFQGDIFEDTLLVMSYSNSVKFNNTRIIDSFFGRRIGLVSDLSSSHL